MVPLKIIIISIASLYLVNVLHAFSHFTYLTSSRISNYDPSKSSSTKGLLRNPTLLRSTPSNPNENVSDDTVTTNSKSYRKGSLMAATAAQGRVPYGEESRRYRRTEFTHDDWVKHRTSEKIVTNLNGLFYSGVVRQLKEEILLVALSATIVVFWNQYLILTGGDDSASWISLLPRLTNAPGSSLHSL